MSGLGTDYLGVGPYGTGTPETAAGNTGLVLSDAYGVSQGSRYINSRTRQYEFDANGRVVGMNNTQHLVQLAMLTVAASSAMVTLGELSPSGVIGAAFVQRRRASVESALAPLVRSKLIEILSIDVDTVNRPVFTRIRWRDLTTTVEQETRI